MIHFIRFVEASNMSTMIRLYHLKMSRNTTTTTKKHCHRIYSLKSCVAVVSKRMHRFKLNLILGSKPISRPNNRTTKLSTPLGYRQHVRLADDVPLHAKGRVLLHVSMAVWRVCFERRLEDLAWNWLRQTLGDAVLALSCVFFLLYTWKDKYGLGLFGFGPS
ncbi:hypothetical protein QQ045_006553 [Rhodiola kirilowii]